MRDLVPYSVCISTVDQDYWELVSEAKVHYPNSQRQDI